MEKNEVLEVGRLLSPCCHLHTSRAVEVRVHSYGSLVMHGMMASIQLAVDNFCASACAGGFDAGGRGHKRTGSLKAIVMNIEILC